LAGCVVRVAPHVHPWPQKRIGNGGVCREVTKRIEMPPLAISPLDAAAPKYRAVVVLGGGISLGVDGQPVLNTDGHRVVMAAQMWHAGKTETIICTGEDDFIPESIGQGDDSAHDRDLHNPARLGIDVLVSLDVPKDRIFRIGGANTFAEMNNLAAFLKSLPAGFPESGDIALITSAFHMSRAMRLAKQQSLELAPIPVSFRIGVPEPLKAADFVPTVATGGQFFLIIRECIARLVGR
jgi:uncharacterized SAM-binding protein YcdF (DUF218 family)